MRLLASCWPFLLGLVFAKENTKIPQGCGGWQHCLETRRDSEVPLIWFDAWNATIQPKLDQLLVTSAGQKEGEWSAENGLLLIMSGDSTIIQQFQLLSELVRLRHDFHAATGLDAGRRQNYELTFGGPKMTPGSVTFLFYRVFESCMLEIRNPNIKTAHALYFGCGMHLLHLIPTQSPALLKVALRSWTNYETLLTSRVEGYREVNPDIKLVYMTTHTIQESKYLGPWLDAIKGYAERDPAYLNACKRKFHEDLPEGSPARSNIEQACVDTVFGARGVKLMNERGIAAMQDAGVAVVPAHGLVAGQAWATALEDGRHYPQLVPLELFLFLNTIEGLS